MEIPNVAVLIWVCALLGFAAYCVTCASHVWWRRNTDRGLTRWQEKIRYGRATALITCFVAAVAMFVVTAAVNLTVPKGVLKTRELSMVRKPEALRVAWATTASEVAAGDVIARYASPELEAQREVAKNKKRELAAAYAALQIEPLKPDEEITRKLLEASSEFRHAESLRGDLIIECGKFERDFHHDQLVKRDDINRLMNERNQAQSLLIQAKARLQRAESSLKRNEGLYSRGAVTADVLEQQQIDFQVAQEEVVWSTASTKQLTATIQELETRLAGLIETNRQRSRQYEGRIALLDRRADENRLLAQQLERDVQTDLERAKLHRAAELESIQAEMQQAEDEMHGFSEMLVERAAEDGKVIFRSDSPAVVDRGEPFLIVSPEDGIRCRLRLPAWQKAGFGDRVTLELISAETELLPQFLVDRRFGAELIAWHDLPDDPSYGMVELRCSPPADAIRHLADGQQIRAALLWTPPMLSHPVFRGALTLFAVGIAAFVILGLFSGAPVTEQEAEEEVPAAMIRPEMALAAEYGSEGAMLHVLGSQLREAVCRRQIDANLLSAAEWALDRYRARAVRLIGIGLGHDEQLSAAVHDLWKTNKFSSSGSRLGRIDLQRKQRLLRTVADQKLREILAELPSENELDAMDAA